MPVTEHRKISDNTLLGIWKITETVAEMLDKMGLSGEDEMTVSAFATDQRKKQWLAYRLLIRAMLPGSSFNIVYDDHGKPHLDGSGFHMSVTHTGDYAAVILSLEGKVGIDIEMIRPRIEKVSRRFLSEGELAGIGEGERLEKMTVYWGVKESLYKLFGRRKLDFMKHIRVPDFTLEDRGSFDAMIIKEKFTRRYIIQYEFMDDMVLVYVLNDNEPG